MDYFNKSDTGTHKRIVLLIGIIIKILRFYFIKCSDLIASSHIHGFSLLLKQWHVGGQKELER